MADEIQRRLLETELETEEGPRSVRSPDFLARAMRSPDFLARASRSRGQSYLVRMR